MNETKPIITDPYYDATSNTIMSSCTMPMFDGNTFIACVTVDVELSSIEKVISEIQVVSHKQQEIADNLDSVVKRFQL